ncbi:MAG: ABC transporter ATP-binding protein [Halodesulfurarchaeum sp.]
MAMLEVDELSYSYGAAQAIRGISLDVEEGEIVVLIGANGAGKTTTVENIIGLYTPDQGTVHFEGEDVTGLGPHEMAERGVALVPEKRRIFDAMTVEENLSMGAYSKRAKAGRAGNLERVYELFPRLEERLDQRSGTMSGGEKQMLSMARGLMTDPELLILDEPSLGLMPELVDAVFEIIEHIVDEGVTVLLVEQNVQQSLDIADRGYVMENGEVRLAKAADDLLQDEHVKESYLGL